MKSPIFSIADVIRAKVAGQNNASLEVVADHTARVRAAGFDVQGLMFPASAFGRTGVTTTVVADQAVSAGFAPMLQNLSVLGRAGATFADLPGHKAGVVQQTGSATAFWVSENPGSDTTKSNLTTALLSLAFKTVQASTSASRQSLFSARGGNFDLDQVIQTDLLTCIAVALDLAGANGLGTSGQPLGILQDTAVSTVTLGTNGGALTRSFAATLEQNVAAANADRPDAKLAFVSTPGVRSKGRTTTDTVAAAPLWRDENTLIGYPALSSNQLPANLTKGTSTTVCSALIFGAWEQLLVGIFGGGVDITIDPYTLKNQQMLDITARVYGDVANRRPTAFQKALDVLAT